MGFFLIPSIIDENKEEGQINLSQETFDFEKNGCCYNGFYTCEEGLVYVDDGILTFAVPEKKARTVLCTVVDCSHNSEECPAYLEDYDVFAIYYYNDKQYLLMRNVYSDGVNAKVYEADVDGRNRRVIYNLEQDDAGIAMPICYNGEIFIFVSSVGSWDIYSKDENGNIVEHPRDISLISYDIDSGNQMVVETFEEAYNQWITVYGLNNGKFYFQYQYSDVPTEELWNGDDEIPEMMSEFFKQGIGVLDLSGSDPSLDSIIEADSVIFMGIDSNKLYWYEYEEEMDYSLMEVHFYDIGSNENGKMIVDSGASESFITVVNGKIFFKHYYNNSVTEYEIKTGDVHVYHNMEYVPIGTYKNYYILGELELYSDLVEFDSLGKEKEYLALRN